MKSHSIRSKFFRVDNLKSKAEQEKYVCEEFVQAYLKETGVELVDGGTVLQDPPDRLFYWNELTIGAELFELDKMYDTRALIEALTTEIYSEIERRELTDKYLGIAISFGSIASISKANEVRTK
ncbi:MAG TPA: hypothetical protein VLA72_07485 [Anaerolineales bacterium]|nr:hypothetical protein [Anaerolineales bacterium]